MIVKIRIEGNLKMRRQLLSLIVAFAILMGTSTCALAKTPPISPPVRIAIQKYKAGNYTGCLQDCQNIVQTDPSNSIAYYYMAMSYVQAGKKDYALTYYAKVLSLTPNVTLQQYAATGKKCLETPDQCRPATDSSDLDKFVDNPNKPLSDSVQQGIGERNLNEVKNEINTDKDVDSYEFRKFQDFSKQHSQAETNDKISQNPSPKTPSNDEIVAALRTLKAAGFSPYSQTAPAPATTIPNAETTAPDPYSQAANYQNADLTALNMLMGKPEQSNSDNTMLNMLPALAAQNKDGTNNYSPQMMQAVIMNSMMNNMNFNLDTDKDK